MSDIWMITGGVRSGKSDYAEMLAAGTLPDKTEIVAGAQKKLGGKALYIATAVPYGDEMTERIAKHREERPESWMTWERYRDLAAIEDEFDKDAFDAILLDCLGNLLMGILFDEINDPDHFSSEEFDRVERLSIAEIDALIAFAKKYDKRLIFVTNEVGMGIVPEGRYSRYYRDALGRINKHTVSGADNVVFMVSGIPMVLK